MSKLKVGAGKACINPSPDMYPVPGSMTDFGLEPMQQMEPYDDLNCRAIAIETDKSKVMFLTFELGSAPNFPGYTEEIAKATGFPKENIFIAGTHNHSAPRTPRVTDDPEILAWVDKFNKIVHDAGMSACQKAVETLRDAKYGYGESLSYINTNRNLLSPGGYWLEARNLAGYSDKTLSILKFVDLDGNLIAAFLNHATHATNLYMLKDADHKAKTSGNFTGITCRFVEEHYGNGAVAMWTSGAAGDQNPVLSHGLQYEYPDGWTTHVQYPDGVGYMQMEYMGRAHGADCVKGIDEITANRTGMPIVHVMQTLELPTRKRAVNDPNPDHSKDRSGGNGLRPESIAYGQLPPPVSPPEMVPDKPRKLDMHLLLLGDIAFLFANAELLSRLGRDMKEASPYKKTVIITHHLGERAGYIFDKESKDVQLPMTYSGVIPGSADDIIVDGEKKLFDMALEV